MPSGEFAPIDPPPHKYKCGNCGEMHAYPAYFCDKCTRTHMIESCGIPAHLLAAPVLSREMHFSQQAFLEAHQRADELIVQKDGTAIGAVYYFPPGKHWAEIKDFFDKVRARCEPPEYADGSNGLDE